MVLSAGRARQWQRRVQQPFNWLPASFISVTAQLFQLSTKRRLIQDQQGSATRN